MIQNEVAILRRVKHPNIVLLIEEMDTYSELYLVMELVKVCTKASMFDMFHYRKKQHNIPHRYQLSVFTFEARNTLLIA